MFDVPSSVHSNSSLSQIDPPEFDDSQMKRAKSMVVNS